jgi:hypothetical protein
LALTTSASAAPRAIGISANGDSACAVMANHSVKCWGYNGAGDLGEGNAPNGSPVPVTVHLI